MGPTCVLLFPLYLSVCYPLRHARIPKTISGFLDFGPNRRYGWTVPIHDSADSVTKFKLATWFFSCFWQIISQEIKLKIWWSCILLESSACALDIVKKVLLIFWLDRSWVFGASSVGSVGVIVGDPRIKLSGNQDLDLEVYEHAFNSYGCRHGRSSTHTKYIIFFLFEVCTWCLYKVLAVVFYPCSVHRELEFWHAWRWCTLFLFQATTALQENIGISPSYSLFPCSYTRMCLLQVSTEERRIAKFIEESVVQIRYI